MTVDSRLCLSLALLGIIGTASMLLAPIELLVPPEAPALSATQIRLLSLLQPILLVLVGVAAGCALARRVGLDAPLLRHGFTRGGLPPLGPIVAPTLLVAAGTAVVILAYANLSAAYLDTGTFHLPLVTRVLYGGISEELMFRWGLMSALVWAAWRVRGQPAVLSPAVYWGAIVVVAVFFAAGHLPFLFSLDTAPAPALIAMVLLGNTLVGTAFGWLFWRYGIEAAIVAHGLAHALAAALTAVL